MKFAELIKAFIEMAADERPEDMLDQLTTAYDGDMGIADEKIAGFDPVIKSLEEEISKLKQHNYDLMRLGDSPSENDESDEIETEENNEDEDIFEEKN